LLAERVNQKIAGAEGKQQKLKWVAGYKLKLKNDK